VLRIDRPLLAVADGRNPLGVDSEIRQEFLGGFGPALTKSQVVFGRAGARRNCSTSSLVFALAFSQSAFFFSKVWASGFSTDLSKSNKRAPS